MWNPFFAARMTGWWRPYGSGDLRQMSSLATETEINIFMIPHFKVLPWNLSNWALYFMVFDLMVFTESSDFWSEVCWGQRDPWTPLPRVMGLEEFEVVKKLVELLESWKGRRCWLWTYQKQKIWGRVAGSWILPHMQRGAPWATGDGVVNFPVRLARRSGFQMLATAHTTNLLKWPGCKGWRWAGLFLRIEIRLFDFGFFHPFWPALCTTTHFSFSDSCQQFVLVMTCLEGLTSATLLRLWMILSWSLYRICRPPSPLVKGALVSEADGGRAQALRPCGLKSLEQRHCVEWWDSGKGLRLRPPHIFFYEVRRSTMWSPITDAFACVARGAGHLYRWRTKVWAQQNSVSTPADWEERHHPKKNSDVLDKLLSGFLFFLSARTILNYKACHPKVGDGCVIRARKKDWDFRGLDVRVGRTPG